MNAADCDLTEINLQQAHVLRCEFGPVRMARAQFQGARICATTFKNSELYGREFCGRDVDEGQLRWVRRCLSGIAVAC